MTLKPMDYDFGDPANYSFANHITCADTETRKMWTLAYGHMLNYNHEEAIACFSRCTELDPNCAMAWWGIAYCVSSNYKWAPGLGSGYDAIQQALSVMDHCSELGEGPNQSPLQEAQQGSQRLRRPSGPEHGQ